MYIEKSKYIWYILDIFEFFNHSNTTWYSHELVTLQYNNKLNFIKLYIIILLIVWRTIYVAFSFTSLGLESAEIGGAKAGAMIVPSLGNLL